jgi:hypothetical protein
MAGGATYATTFLVCEIWPFLCISGDAKNVVRPHFLTIFYLLSFLLLFLSGHIHIVHVPVSRVFQGTSGIQEFSACSRHGRVFQDTIFLSISSAAALLTW